MTNSPRRPDPSRIAAAPALIDRAYLDSPLLTDTALDARLGCRVLAKVETLNPIRSFKGRGTDLVLATLHAGARHVVTASAGNFGQGVARAASRRRSAATVFAARTANPLKLDAMRRFGAEIVLDGEDFDAAKDAARLFAEARGLPFLEDGAVPEIAEGAGTIALEMTRAAGFDVMLAPLGNGALLTGLGTWLKAERPACRVVGVVAAAAPSMRLSWLAGATIPTDTADTIADGVAIRQPVDYALACMAGTVDDVLEVSEASIVAAIRLLHETLGLVVEPAGALGIAAILEHPGLVRGAAVGTILCGGNATTAQLRRWLFEDGVASPASLDAPGAGVA